MAEYTCKFCGTKTPSPSSGGTCVKNPNSRNHEWINAKSEYVCKFCGTKTSSPTSGGTCVKSPHPLKNHEWL